MSAVRTRIPDLGGSHAGKEQTHASSIDSEEAGTYGGCDGQDLDTWHAVGKGSGGET
jgi:hypothetical protein